MQLNIFFHQHPDVIELKNFSGDGWLEHGSILWEDGGFAIYGFPREDLYMLKTPDGMWKSVRIGQTDEEFNHEILEKKYGHKHLFNAYLKEFWEFLPIYL